MRCVCSTSVPQSLPVISETKHLSGFLKLQVDLSSSPKNKMFVDFPIVQPLFPPDGVEENQEFNETSFPEVIIKKPKCFN